MLPELVPLQFNVILWRTVKRQKGFTELNASWKCAENGTAAVLQAKRLQSASPQCIAVVAAMLSQCELAVRLGHVITDPIELHRGLPQGAPESPTLFILVCELVLRPLLLRWQTEGKGWFFCAYWLASLGYADTILGQGYVSSLTPLQKSALTSVWTSALGGHILQRNKGLWLFVASS